MRIFGTKHSRNIARELLHIAVVVRTFDQHVLTAQLHAWHVLHALFQFGGLEVVLEDFVEFQAFNLENELLHYQERPREVKPAHGPLCFALEEFLRTSKSFLHEFPFSSHE